MVGRPSDGPFQLSLLLLVATGFAAVLWTGRLDRGTAVAAAAALAARVLIISRGWRAPLAERWVRVLAIAYIGFYPIDFLYLSGDFLNATVRLVFFLAAIKLLTARTGRDYLYLGLIAFLELLSAAMLTASPAILAFLLLFLFFATAARTQYEILSSMEKADHLAAPGRMGSKLTALNALLALGIAVVGVGLFFVVPRAAGAYLSRLPPTGQSMLGFSDEIVLGTSGRLRRDSTPVLRVHLLEGKPAGNLKWRGGAWQRFDGVRWSNPPSVPQSLDSQRGYYPLDQARRRFGLSPEGAAVRVRYSVQRSPMDSNALFLTGTPEEVKGDFPRLEVSGTDSISIPGGRWRALRYEAISLIAQLNPAEPPEQEGPYPARLRAAYLQLPELDPRIPQLARYITESQITPYARATAIERYLRTEFGYTLELPAERPPDPLADFLFRRKKGHCEYFASAMAVMLRSIGIPARVASGFQSGLYNSVSHYYTVRASEAHAWVEAYLPGYGWATFDPTPPDPRAFGTLAGLWQYVDALETFWNDWVIEYDVTRQLNLARSVQAEWYRSNYDALAVWERGWDWTAGQWRHWRRAPVNQVLPRALGGLAGLLAVGLAVWAWPGLRAMLAARRVRRGHGRSEDCALLYQRALRQFERRGFVRQSCQTATEFAAAVRPPHCPASAADLFRQITLAYNRARFGRDLEAGRQLPGLIRSLETLPR